MLTPREAVLNRNAAEIGWAREHREAERGGERAGAEGGGLGGEGENECDAGEVAWCAEASGEWGRDEIRVAWGDCGVKWRRDTEVWQLEKEQAI